MAARLPPAGGILRAGPWRWLRSVAWMVVLLATLVSILSLQSIVRHFAPDATLLLVIAFVTVVLAYGAYAGLVSRLERRVVQELAPSRMPVELAIGLLVGMALMAIVVGTLALSGAYAISWASWSDWPHDLREALGTGLLEELLARLVVFRLLACAVRVRPALLLSALLFGGAHLGNPHATVISSAAIAVEAGLMLAGFYLLTGRIWLSVEVHAGWNLMQGGIFGAAVSGMASEGSHLRSMPLDGIPDWWSGGAFGPEGSIVAVLVGLSACCTTLGLLRRATIDAGSLHDRAGPGAS